MKNTKELTIRRRTWLQDMQYNWQLYVMVLPAVLFFFIFNYVPFAGVVLAFKKFNFFDGIWRSPWCGFENFKFLIVSGKAWALTRNTILYNMAFMIVATVFEVTLSIFLSEINAKYFKKITQTVMLFPHFISWVVIGIFMYQLLNYDTGIINNMLSAIGLDKVEIYSEAKWWPFILVATYEWKSFGYGSIVYLATIMGFDRECYEAAEIDGATLWQRTRYITLPMLKPIVTIMVVMAIGRLVRGNFELFYQLLGSSPRGDILQATDIIETYVFRSVLSATELGVSTATGLYQSVLSCLLVFVANGVVRKLDSDNALF